jgi:tRNA 2-thiocytidine biosynthesis protein TtcA
MDRALFPFATLAPTGIPDAAGDKAFDDDGDGCATPVAAAVVRLQRS